MKILTVLLACAISSTIAISVACGIALTSPVLADDYQPQSTGTKESDCTYRGSDRREECI
jgi:hypothetical protein